MVEQQIRTWDVLDQDVLDLLLVVRRVPTGAWPQKTQLTHDKL